MKKRFLLLALALIAVFSLCACKKGTRIVTCDGCGADIEVSKDSNVTDDWIVYCNDCEVKFGLDKLPEN